MLKSWKCKMSTELNKVKVEFEIEFETKVLRQFQLFVICFLILFVFCIANFVVDKQSKPLN